MTTNPAYEDWISWKMIARKIMSQVLSLDDPFT